jgi:GTP-binding protein
VSRTLRAVKRADVCLLLIDATDGMSEQDKRIIGYCIECGTAMVLVWTKWDLIENKEKKFKALADEIDLKMPLMKYVPYLTISNLTRQRVFEVFTYIDRVAEQAELRIDTPDLNKFFEELKNKHQPPSRKGKTGRIKYATQVGVKPTTFVLFVNDVDLIHFSYQRFIENQLREKYGFDGVPLKLELRQGAARHE